ncbi:MAG: PspA/IM30 family protein [Myxococcota bacterium]|jgi:phage shock protein A|nr:PspA/IM30 family protein [Myxococcota bacterium]
MNIVDRLTTLAKANINNLLARAEDPEKILDQLILDMQAHYRETKISVAEAIASEKRLERQTTQTLVLAQQWEKKAMMAVRAGRDDLAKEALRRKGEQDELASEYKIQLELAQAMSEQLKDGLRKLDAKIGEARRKRTQLVMRARQVEAMEKMQTIQENLSDDTAFSALARVEAKIEEQEARVEAMQVLAGEEKSLELDFAELESERRADDALTALKAKLGMTQSREEAGTTTPAFVFEEEEEAAEESAHVPQPARRRATH